MQNMLKMEEKLHRHPLCIEGKKENQHAVYGAEATKKAVEKSEGKNGDTDLILRKNSQI